MHENTLAADAVPEEVNASEIYHVRCHCETCRNGETEHDFITTDSTTERIRVNNPFWTTSIVVVEEN